MEQGVLYPVVVKPSSIVGKGLFAARDIKAGEVVAPYRGEILVGDEVIHERCEAIDSSQIETDRPLKSLVVSRNSRDIGWQFQRNCDRDFDRIPEELRGHR